MQDIRYDVFISYRRADGQRFANRLRRALVQAHRRLPVERPPLRVYLDRIFARATEDFYRDEIRPALLASRWQLILATPLAEERPGQTDWVSREIGDFEATQGLSQMRVIHARGKTLPRLPHGIQDRMPNAQQIDLRGMGDLFAAGQSRDDWLALLATLFEIPAEEMPALRRIEERARRNRIAFAAGATFGGIAFATAVSGYAIYRDAETRRLLDLSAATLGMSIGDDPEANWPACDALTELWASGAERRAIPTVRCRAAEAWLAFTGDGANDPAAAAAALGTWDELVALLPPVTNETDGEHADARFDFELEALQYRLFAASGLWLGGLAENGISAPALPFALEAAELARETLTEAPDVGAATDVLLALIWPLTEHLEAADRMDDSLDLMIRVADALQPVAERLIGIETPDAEAVLQYGILRRRAAHFLRIHRNDLPAAKIAADQAVAILQTLHTETAETTFQVALGYLVRAETLEAMGEDPVADFTAALGLVRIAQRDVAAEDWLVRELAGLAAELEPRLSPGTAP